MREKQTGQAAENLSDPIAMIKANPHVFVVPGILLIILGIGMLAAPYLATLTVEYVLGFTALFIAIPILYDTVMNNNKSGRASAAEIGILSFAVGLFILLKPFESAEVLTLALGIYFLADGLARAFMAFEVRESKGWRFMLILGSIASVILGVLIIVIYPVTSQWLLGWLAGLNILLSGTMILLLGLKVRNANEALATTGD